MWGGTRKPPYRAFQLLEKIVFLRNGSLRVAQAGIERYISFNFDHTDSIGHDFAL